MKHEKALLVALSYVIGFVTAFIAFGLHDSGKWYKSPDFQYKYSGDNHVTGNNQEKVNATVKAEGLYAILNGHERILSAFASAPTLESGYHHQIIATAVAPSGEYIYYCAEEDAGQKQCANYIYVVEKDTIYLVKANGVDEQLLIPSDDLNVSWTEAGRLMINGYMSSSELEPWKVAGRVEDSPESN